MSRRAASGASDRPDFGADPSFLEPRPEHGKRPFRRPPTTPRAGVGGDAASLSPHGTTVVALRYADGVIPMAGDRRATEGYYNSRQSGMNKVFAADEHPCVGHRRRGRPGDQRRSGSSRPSSSTTRRSRARCSRSRARPTGLPNSSELSSFALIMQGLVVVPIYAGYDLGAHPEGRIFRYDASAAATRRPTTTRPAPGSRDWRRRASRSAGRPGRKTAALEATRPSSPWWTPAKPTWPPGGPDPTRNIFPSVFSWSQRAGGWGQGRGAGFDDVRRRLRGGNGTKGEWLMPSMPFYVAAGTAHEGSLLLRPEGHSQGQAR